MKGNPKSPSHNHGVQKEGKFNTPFGKDDSDYTGSAAKERSTPMGGGVNNVDHSLSNTSKK